MTRILRGLILLSLATALFGCAAAEKTAAPTSSPGEIADHLWTLTHWDGGEPAPSEPEVTLTYEAGRISGKSGCNNYFSGFEADRESGAVKMLRRSVQWFALLPDVCQGIDVHQLREDAARVRAALDALDPADIDTFDRSLLKPVRLVADS